MAEISKTADQALTVLLEVGERGPVTSTEIARSLGMNRTVVHRLLTTLHQRGFITRGNDGFVPGPMLVRVAARVQPQLRAHGRAVMQRLSDSVSETVVMHIPDDGEAVVLDQVVAEDNVVRVEHKTGSRHPLTVGASGRAILAFLGDPAIDRILRRDGDANRVRAKLTEIRENGYAVSHDELQQGVYGLAVPVLDATGLAVASLAILAPVMRAENLTKHSEALMKASRQLSRALKSSPV